MGAPRELAARSSASHAVRIVTEPSIEVAEIAQVSGAEELRSAGNEVTLRTRRPTETAAGLTRLLAARNVEIVELQVRKATLEDVFIGLTGKDPM